VLFAANRSASSAGADELDANPKTMAGILRTELHRHCDRAEPAISGDDRVFAGAGPAALGRSVSAPLGDVIKT